MIALDSVKDYKVLFVGEAIMDEYQYVRVIGKAVKENALSAIVGKREEFRGGTWAAAAHAANFCAQVDAWVGPQMIEMARQMADQTGIGAVCVKNSTPFGAAAYFGLQVSRKGYMAFAFTNAGSLVKAYGSDRAFFGTNPICFTVPMRNEDPFCLDMATSQVSWNKIKIYRMKKESVPEDWGFGPDGRPTKDPEALKSLNPIGLYKGYGLGIMVEILCSLMASGPIALQVIPMFTRIHEKRSISHFFMVLDIGKFRLMESFLDDLQNMVEQVRSLPTLEGVSSVMIPGDPEKRVFKERSLQGIPIDENSYEDFLLLSQDFSGALNV